MYTAKEQAEHRKQWVEALRSGKYHQGRGALRVGEKFCCLGVACDISGLGQWVPLKVDNVPTLAQAYHIDSTRKGDVLLPGIVDWLGVTHPEVRYTGEKVMLTVANDDGYDFNAIADIIESGKIFITSTDKWP